MAGGRSSRMGQDKALLCLAGQTLAERALGILRAAQLPACFAGGAAELSHFAPVCSDEEAYLGPLGGICAALTASTASYAVFLPVDLPFLPPALLRVLLDRARMSRAAVTLASVEGFTQSFPAVIARRALTGLQTALRSESRGCLRAFRSVAEELGQTLLILQVEHLLAKGELPASADLPPSAWFLNINSAGDFQAAVGHNRPRIPEQPVAEVKDALMRSLKG